MLFCQVKCKKICGCVQVSDEVHLKLVSFFGNGYYSNSRGSIDLTRRKVVLFTNFMVFSFASFKYSA